MTGYLMKIRNNIIYGLIFILLFLTISIIFYKTTVNIAQPYGDFTERESMYYAPVIDTVYFGVISRYPSNVIYRGYQPIMDYLTKNTDYHFELLLSDSYDETVNQLVSGEAHAAFLGSYIYVQAHDLHGIICILKPLNENQEPFFRSVLITHPRTGIKSIKDLSGKRLALPSQQSFSGNWLPISLLDKNDISIDDLGAVQFFPFHQSVVYEVLRGNFDAGAVKDRVAQEYSDRGIDVFAYSDPIPGSPIVVPRDYDEAIVKAIMNALLAIDPADPEYSALIRDWDPEFAHGFVPAHNEDYNTIRDILRQFGENR